jgi:hypothetical protein
VGHKYLFPEWSAGLLSFFFGFFNEYIDFNANDFFQSVYMKTATLITIENDDLFINGGDNIPKICLSQIITLIPITFSAPVSVNATSKRSTSLTDSYRAINHIPISIKLPSTLIIRNVNSTSDQIVGYEIEIGYFNTSWSDCLKMGRPAL